MMDGMKVLLYYSKQILKYNTIISVSGTTGFSGIAVLASQQLSYRTILIGLNIFFLIYLSFGYVFAVFLYHYFKKNEYPVYYNKGYRIWQCVVVSYVIHFTVILVFFVIMSNIRFSIL